MNDVVIYSQTGHFFISPTGFLVYSKDFYDAYRSYKSKNPFSPASYYLICRSIELSMKAYLLTKGINRNELKKKNIGHDLINIMKKAKDYSFLSVVSISDIEQDHLDKANRWYARKGFEYFEIENIVQRRNSLPDLKILEQLAERLINILRPICLAASDE